MSDALAWVGMADNDLDAADRCLAPPPNLAVAAYHCQQAAEKLLKALLVDLRLQYPRGRGGHDLLASAELLPPNHPLRARAIGLDVISDWSTAFRYPSDDPFMAEPLPTPATLSEWLLKIRQLRDDVASSVARSQSGR